jgi:Transposase domain (DUF772)
LLRALLLQAFYSVRSETQLMEQLEYNLLFRWFVGLSLDDEIWDVSVFTKNRERLIEGDIAKKIMAAVLDQEALKALLSDDHFSVDGTLIEAWAGMKSFRPQDGSGEPPAPGRNGQRDFHGEKRNNETHASTTDPDARLYRKSLPCESRGTGPPRPTISSTCASWSVPWVVTAGLCPDSAQPQQTASKSTRKPVSVTNSLNGCFALEPDKSFCRIFSAAC